MIIIVNGFNAKNAVAWPFPYDVPPGHWAYDAVKTVTELGIMYGLTAGYNARFAPYEFVGMFDTARTLAYLAGFVRYGATDAQQTEFDEIYRRHAATIELYSSDWSLWRHDFNREIAFLLEHGIFIAPDLENFVSVVDGVERENALARVWFVLFLARLMDVADEARNFTHISDNFGDHHEIPVLSRAYVYYMREIGLIRGDDHNNFNPWGGVNRAAMAIMLSHTLEFIGFELYDYSAASPTAANITAIVGEIMQVHTVFNAVEIRNLVTLERIIHPVYTGAAIFIGGVPADYEMLQTGMQIAAIIEDGEIINMIAMLNATVFADQPVRPIGVISSERHFAGSNLLDGIIYTTRDGEEGRSIGLQMRRVNTLGVDTTMVQSFILHQNATITRGLSIIDFDAISAGDIATITAAGLTIHNIHLEDSSRSIRGAIISRRHLIGGTGGWVVVEESAIGRMHELYINNDTGIIRIGHQTGEPNWADLRVGDIVEVRIEDNRVKAIWAEGNRRTLDGVVTGIQISAARAALTIIHSDGEESTFPVIPGRGVDISVRQVGEEVRINLDSNEIEQIFRLSSTVTQSTIGTIVSVLPNYIQIFGEDYEGEAAYLYFSQSMSVIDNATSAILAPNDLQENMQVFITYITLQDINYAIQIVIIGRP